MESMAVLSQNHTDLSSMDKPEVSKSLFGLIQWEEILRSGVFLAHRDVSIITLRNHHVKIDMETCIDEFSTEETSNHFLRS